jgi:2-polyprenyl-3-methyl-5-hydroxy-6-metoxy-1,4-benzoquinol methylase
VRVRLPPPAPHSAAELTSLGGPLKPRVSFGFSPAVELPTQANIGFEWATQPETAVGGMNMDVRTHWEKIYSTKASDQVSWYRPHLETSLALIKRAAGNRTASIVDVGGGESTLVDDLLEQGFQNITVLDVSQAAIDVNKARLGERATGIQWMVADITRVELQPRAYDVWHDRAVFHFLTEREERTAYVRQVSRSVRSGGYVIVSTFGPDGPTRCSGLDVVRYDADSLHDEFGARFRLVESSKEVHQTPFGTTQQFLYCYCRVE